MIFVYNLYFVLISTKAWMNFLIRLLKIFFKQFLIEVFFFHHCLFMISVFIFREVLFLKFISITYFCCLCPKGLLRYVISSFEIGFFKLFILSYKRLRLSFLRNLCILKYDFWLANLWPFNPLWVLHTLRNSLTFIKIRIQYPIWYLTLIFNIINWITLDALVNLFFVLN